MDISLSAHANARRWYDLKKKQESKQEKTISAHEKAFKAAERKTRLQLSQVAFQWPYFPLHVVLITYHILYFWFINGHDDVVTLDA